MESNLLTFYGLPNMEAAVDYIISTFINGNISEAKKVFSEVRYECQYIGQPDMSDIKQMFIDREEEVVWEFMTEKRQKKFGEFNN